MRVAVIGLMLLFVSGRALADMIEIKGKGFLNGKIISETSDTVLFKDAKGNEHSVKRSDIVYLEHQEESAPSKSWAQRTSDMLGKAMKKETKAPVAASRRQTVKTDSTPSEPSTLLGMSGMASQALDMAGQAQAQMQIQQAKINKAMREAEGGGSGEAEHSNDPSSPYYDASKGRFSGLANE